MVQEGAVKLPRIEFTMRCMLIAVVPYRHRDHLHRSSVAVLDRSPRWRIACKFGPVGDERNVWYEFDMRSPEASQDWQKVMNYLMPAIWAIGLNI